MVTIKSNDDSHKIQCIYCRNMIVKGEDCPYCREILFSGRTELENQIDKLQRERELLKKERIDLEQNFKEFKRKENKFREYYIKSQDFENKDDFLNAKLLEHQSRQLRFILDNIKTIIEGSQDPEDSYNQILNFKEKFYLDDNTLSDLMIGSLLDIKFGQNCFTIEQMTLLKKKKRVNVFFDKSEN